MFSLTCYFQSASLIRCIMIWTKIEMNTQFLFPLRLFYVVALTQQCHCVCGLRACATMPSILAQGWRDGSEFVDSTKVEWTCQRLQDKWIPHFANSANLTHLRVCCLTQETIFSHHPSETKTKRITNFDKNTRDKLNTAGFKKHYVVL